MDFHDIIRTKLNLIGRLRKEHTARLAGFIDLTGFDRTHYSKLETVATDLMLSTFLKICYHLGIKVFLDTPWGFYELFTPDMVVLKQPLNAQAVRRVKSRANKKKKRKKELKDEYGGFI